jgi:hypothetical protein
MQLRNGRIIENKLIIKDNIINDDNIKDDIIINDDNIKDDIINDYDKENIEPLPKRKSKNKCKKLNVKKCGFCRKPGHTINNCKDSTIYEIDQYFYDVALLDFLQVQTSYTAQIIMDLPESSIKVICYLHNISYNNSIINIANILMEKYINSQFENLLKEIKELNNENICQFLENMYSKVLEFRIDVEDTIITPKYFFQKMHFIFFKETISNRYFIKIQRVSNNLLDTKSTIQNSEDNNNTIECPICYSELDNNTKLITQCGHYYCYTCFYNYLDTLKNDKYILPCCCFCRKTIDKIYYCNINECNKIQNNFLLPNLFILDAGPREVLIHNRTNTVN